MKKYYVILCLLITSCGYKQESNLGETVVYNPKETKQFEDIVNSIEYIPLGGQGLCFDPMITVYMDDSSYYFVDRVVHKKIFRFDKTGYFKNTIGQLGRARNEYSSLNDCYVDEEGIVTYSSSDRAANYYKPNGELLKRVKMNHDFDKACKFGDDYLLYIGDNNGRSDAKLYTNGNKTPLMASNESVMNFGETFPVLTRVGDEIFIRETMYNQLNVVRNGKMENLYRFDFGSMNIPESHYTANDPSEGMMKLMERSFVALHSFVINANYLVMTFGVKDQNSDKMPFIYAIQNRNNAQWQWFKEIEGETVFSGTFKYMDEEGYLYFLVNEDAKGQLAEYGIKSGDEEFGLIKCRIDKQ
ncbi:MAG: 6-bladed beta-propeller [Marinifilaceae bacterium]